MIVVKKAILGNVPPKPCISLSFGLNPPMLHNLFGFEQHSFTARNMVR